MAAHAAALSHPLAPGCRARWWWLLCHPMGTLSPRSFLATWLFPCCAFGPYRAAPGVAVGVGKPCGDELCQTAPCHTVPTLGTKKPPSGWAPQEGSHPLRPPAYGVPPPFSPQPHLKLWGRSGVPAASTLCACSRRVPCVAHAVPGRAESPVPPPCTPVRCCGTSCHPSAAALRTDGRRRLWDTVSCCYR